jgi:hypothetical protein
MRAAGAQRAKLRSEINNNVDSLMQETAISSLSEKGDIQPLLERQTLDAHSTANIAGTTNKPTFKKELQELARRYESLREDMKVSHERTKAMESIAAGMRGLALTSYECVLSSRPARVLESGW